MSEEHLKYVVVKRTTKKKSGYVIEERDGEYYVADVPAKARVTVGDKVVTINGVDQEDFEDEEDANDLLESIRVVVVPKDELDDYDAAVAEEEGSDGDDEDSDDLAEKARRGKARDKPDRNGRSKAAAAASTPAGRGGKELSKALVVKPEEVHVCHNCGLKNVDLEPDEEGDLVCEECGHVLEPNKVYDCDNCHHRNVNPVRDEEGDLVCEECNHVLHEPKVHHCGNCQHENVDLERDEEGDLVCEECGHVIPEDWACEHCGQVHDNPEEDEDGDFICDNCGEVLPERPEGDDAPGRNSAPDRKGAPGNNGALVPRNDDSDYDSEDEEAKRKSKADKLNALNDKGGDKPGKNEFDEGGNPTTGTDGKKLTPADMFSPGDVITVTVGKSNPKQDSGLKIEEKNGKYYIRKVPSGGLFAKTPVIATDKILELNGKDSRDYKHVNELKKVLKDEPRITIVVLRRDPDASESEASSVDYDNLAPITADGVQREEVVDRDDSSIGYDGHDCGCKWCPDCH